MFNDTVLVIPTSGTTGMPKMVPLTQANVEASARAWAGALGLRSTDRCLNGKNVMRAHKQRLPTFYQAACLRRIAQTGRMMLTHDVDEGDRYADGAGITIDERTAKQIIRNGWVVPDQDSIFDLAPQSWRVKTL